MTKPRPDNTIEINRKKAQLNEEEDRYLRKLSKGSAYRDLRDTAEDDNPGSGKVDDWLKNQDQVHDSESLFDNDNTEMTSKQKARLNYSNMRVKLPVLLNQAKFSNNLKKSSISESSLTNAKSDTYRYSGAKKFVSVSNDISAKSSNQQMIDNSICDRQDNIKIKPHKLPSLQASGSI